MALFLEAYDNPTKSLQQVLDNCYNGIYDRTIKTSYELLANAEALYKKELSFNINKVKENIKNISLDLSGALANDVFVDVKTNYNVLDKALAFKANDKFFNYPNKTVAYEDLMFHKARINNLKSRALNLDFKEKFF
jgi:sucrose-6-phosphate hydrolase SacC (GH32 family)